MTSIFLPSTLGRIALPDWQFPPHIQALQDEILDTLYDPNKNRLIVEIPVRHGKSFFCSYVFPSWFMMRHPNKSIWVVSYGADFATEWSSKVRNLVGEWGPKCTGVELDPTFKPRDHFRLKAPHIGDLRGLGLFSGMAGKGAHVIVCDDLIKEFGDIATEEGREKIHRQFHGEVLNRLEPGGKVIMVMSRRHPDDLSGRLLASNEDLDPVDQWRRIKFQALSDDDSTALWPERYPVDRLKSIRRVLEVAGTPWIWHSLYQQDPATAAELCEWPASYWKEIFYTERPDFRPVLRLMSLDPSLGKHRRKGDFSALLYGEVDNQGALWVDDTILKRIPVTPLEDLAVGQLETHKPDAFAIEVNNFQEVVANNFFLKAGPGVPIYPYQNMRGEAKAAGYSQQMKEVEIRILLTPYLAQGLIKIKDTPQGRILGQQLRDFPEASHDDGPDALALMVRLWRDLLGGAGQATGGDQRVLTR